MSRLFIAPAAFAVVMTLAGPAVAAGGGAEGRAEIGDEAVAGRPGEDGSIVVTAAHRAQRLEGMPMALAAVTPEAIAHANVDGIQEPGRVASGGQINHGGISTQAAIRGVALLTNGYGVEPRSHGGRLGYSF